MNYQKVKQGVNNAKSFLKSHTQNDCISFDNRNSIVSWLGRKPGIFKNTYYPLEYQYLLDHHQYSILLSDGSFFQFFYKFDGNIFSKARLAYYPMPLSTSDSSDDLQSAAEEAMDRSNDDLYEHLFNWLELLELHGKSPSNTSHVRFDFDSKVTSHCKSHIQFGGVQEFRVPSR